MSDDKFENGTFQGHTSCPECGSSDGLAIYTKKDETDGYCWVCNTFFPPDKMETVEVKKVKRRRSPEEIKEIIDEINTKDYSGWIDRRLNKSVAQKYGVKSDYKVAGKPTVRYYPVYAEEGELCGYKVRVVEGKRFWTVGVNNNSCQMFGQNLFSSGGDILIITGGEEDALSWYQCLVNNDKGYYTPAVSVTCGETSAVQQVKNNYDYITSFDKVIISMDNDKVGRKAAEDIARVLKPGQGYIPDFHFKDASEALSEGRGRDLQQYYWRVRNDEVEPYSPVGIVKLSQMWSAFEDDESSEMIPLPEEFGSVNTMLNGGIEMGEVTVIGALTSIGKGQPLWENVVTPTGYRKVGDIRVGDELIGSNGKPTKVIGVFPQGEQDIYRITLKDGSVVHCDENHLWQWMTEHQYRNGHRGQVTTVKEMKERMESGVSRPKVILPRCKPVEYKNTGELPMDPWLLGVILGDGGLTSGSVKMTNREHYIVDRFKKCVGQFNKNLSITHLGIMVGSKEKFIPDAYMMASPCDRLSLLQGLFDAGGSVVKNSANLEYSTSSKVMAYQVKDLVRSLGLTARVVKRNSSYVKNGIRVKCDDSYRVFIKQNDDMNVFTSPKHHSRYKRGRTVARDVVETIELVGRDETVCFKVDAEDELYLTNDYIVTHNTTIVSHIVNTIMTKTNHKIGAIYLEGTQKEVVRDIMSIHTKTNLRRIPRKNLDMRKLRQEFLDGPAKDDRFVFVDHQGLLGADALFDKMQYLAKVEGCKVIIIDPIQAAVQSTDNAAVIEFMDRVLKLAKQTNVAVILVSHMRKPERKGPHEVDEYDLLGSSAINQISFNTILISRDKMHNDPIIKNSTRVAVVKCRRTGETGEAGWFTYDPDTTLIHSATDPYKGADIRAAMTDLDDGMTIDDLGSDLDADDDFENYE